MLLAFLLSFSAQTAWAQDLTISSTTDWNSFAAAINNGTTYSGQTVALTADIEVSTMAGTSTNKFCGTFIGNGHTLTLDLTTDGSEYTAPFRYVDGASIKLLHTAGNVNGGNQKFATGLIGNTDGVVTITACRSSVAITSDRSGASDKDATHGGFIGVAGGTVTFSNCLFDGSITDEAATNCGGFVGWRNGTLTFYNCLMAGTMTISSPSGSATFNRNNGESTTLNNCYYKTSYGDVQGTQTDATGSNLKNLLGSNWQVSGDAVVPIMDAKNLATATISGISSHLYYTGKPYTITYTVTTADGTALTESTHYTVTITKDGSISNVQETGDYTLTITAIDGSSYTGTQTFNFTVNNTPLGMSEDSKISEGTVGHYYVNMPATGETTIEIPEGFTSSFKVYDDGGSTGNYSDNCDGTLKLTAPDDYVLQLSGNITTETDCDLLTAYDGSDDTGKKLLDEVGSTNIIEVDYEFTYEQTAITTVHSSGQDITLYFRSDEIFNYAGLDLTVTLVYKNPENAITVSNPETAGGSVVASVGENTATTAKVNETVTLTATPSKGYILSDITVVDAYGNTIEVAWDIWSNSATFTMPRSAVTVTPTFTNDLTSLYINMPKTGTKEVTIPQGVQSFKVYDDGGKSGDYSKNCDGYLIIIAPDGYALKFSGSILTRSGGNDYITVYAGGGTDGMILANQVYGSSTTNIDAVICPKKSLTVYFKSAYGNAAGFDLTVECIDNKAKTYDCPDWLAIDPTKTEGTDGYYFVNMPATGINTLTLTEQDITDGKGTFKVYDNGGKSGDYSKNCDGYLIIIAPDGYALKFSGSILTRSGGNDYITVYAGGGTDGVILANQVYGKSTTNIDAVICLKNSLTVYFKASTGPAAGFDLTVECIDNKSKIYDCPDWLAIDPTKEKGTDGYYYLNMPNNGSAEYEIPDGFEESFQVRYRTNYYRETGKITLTAPSGRKMVYSGEWTDGAASTSDCKYTISDGSTTQSGSTYMPFSETTTAYNSLDIECFHWGRAGNLTLNVRMKPDPIRISNINEFYQYTGDAISVVPTVTDADNNNATLTSGTDYEVTFSPAEVKDKGVYTATISGKGSYSFSKTFNFLVGTLDYVDADGATQTIAQSGLTLLTTRTELPATLTGWYLVADNITFNNDVEVSGEAHLILADGATMSSNKRIRVNSGNTLNIYGQTGGTGRLTVSTSGAVKSDASIGASYGNNCGTIVINGGDITVTAQKKSGASAIGADANNSCGSITINGGRVTAAGSKKDIGGNSGSVTINGGQVTTANASGIGATTVSLGWKNSTTDFILAMQYSGTVTFQEGKFFVLDGTTTGATLDNIAGHKIVPAAATIAKDLAQSTISGIAEYYNPDADGIALSYTVTDMLGSKLTKGTDFTEAFTDNSTNQPVAKITDSGIYTLTITGSGSYTGTQTALIYVAGYKETLGGHEFTVQSDDDGLYYVVDSEDALRALAAHVTAGNTCAGKRFVQTQPITLNGYFPRIGVSGEGFGGTYDGGGKAISGLSVSTEYGEMGLFATVKGGTIKNVVLVRPSFTATTTYNRDVCIGAIVGSCHSFNSQIENCHVISPTITVNNSNYNIGTFVGYVKWTTLTMKDCYYYGSDLNAVGYTNQATYSPTNVAQVYKITADGFTIATPTISIDGTDYYKSGTSVTATATVTESGMKKFTATGVDVSATETSGQYTFTVPANDVTLSLDDVTPSITIAEGSTYNGNAQTPEITVTVGETSLTAGTDYTIEYTDNINAGTATVTITGKGFYLGTASQTFTIAKAPIAPVVSIEGWTYGDPANTPSVTGNMGNGTVSYQYRPSANGAPDFSDVVPTNAGQRYAVRATIAESDNYKGGTAEAYFKIAPKPVTITGLSIENKTYDGTTTATVTGTATIEGKIGDDDVDVYMGSAAFENANVGTGKTVTFSGFSLTGDSFNNYTLSSQPASVTADITAKFTYYGALTISENQDGKTAILDEDMDGISIDEDITGIKSVEFNRTFTPTVYSTIILPFDAKVDASEGCFYAFKKVTPPTGGGTKWVADFYPVKYAEANKPYIFIAKVASPTFNFANEKDKSIKNATEALSSPGEAEEDETESKWTFIGVYSKIEWSEKQENIYGFAGTENTEKGIAIGDFVRAGDNSSVRPFRCYLTYDGVLSKSTSTLPDRIEVRIVSAVAEPDEPSQNPNSDITTPTSELAPAANVKVWSYDKTICIAAAPNTPYRIIDATGRVLKDGITQTDRDEIRLGNHSGIAIVVINNKTFKVSY